MSFVGKILIVVQVVMSLCFMAFAGAVYVTHENWQVKYQDLEEKLSAIETSRKDLEQNLSEAREERDQQVDEATKLRVAAEQQVVLLEQQVANLQNTVNNAQQENERLQALADSKQVEAGNREAEAETLRKSVASLQEALNAVANELNQVKDDRFNIQTELARLQKVHNDVVEQAAFLEKVVRKHGLPTDPALVVAMKDPPPVLEGIVEVTEKDRTDRTKYIVVSVGKDDGLLVGHKLYAYRLGSKTKGKKTLYLGVLKVIEVRQDKAVAEVIERTNNGNIEVGDNVATRL